MTTVNQTAPSPAADAPAEALVSASADAPAVLAEISGMLRTMLDEYGLDDIEVTMETRFTEDLELESIDLVTLAGSLETRYGRQVNFAEFVADLELDEIIDLTVGQLVEYVVRCLRAVRER
ncbi:MULTISPECIES: acyl carrier protein [Streptomyces]|uniref:acyl carrier protein n=1 Tax=Streptomyces lycopersici TaxID=2974589 RepID=UPI0035260D0B